MPTRQSRSEHRRFNAITIIAWLCVVVWAIFIFFMSAHTGNDLSTGTGIVAQVHQLLVAIQASLVGPDIDLVSPVAHFFEYTVFGFLMYWALASSFSNPSSGNPSSDVKPGGFANNATRIFIIAVVICSLYAVTDEFHQYFVPERACDPVDWLVDTCGSALGAFIAKKFLQK